MAEATRAAEPSGVRATEELMVVSRTMTAIVARTFSEVAEEITVPQLRVLVLLSSRGPMNMSTIAHHLGVNPSNASRTCDQLIGSGKVARQTNEQDRRGVVLHLTGDGLAFVEQLMMARRRLIEEVVARMADDDKVTLARGLEAFSAAVDAGGAEGQGDPSEGGIIAWLR